MRILFEDFGKNSTVYATNESANYPSLDIIHPFITRRFQATAPTSTVTFEFSEDKSINSIFYAFHNLTALTIRLLDSLDAVQKTIVVSDIQDMGIEYFTTETGIRKIEYDLTSTTFVFIGGIGCGVFYQMPDFLNSFTGGGNDNSLRSKSPSGQTLKENRKPLRTESFNFRDLLLSVKDEILDNLDNNGTGPFYIDFTEGDRTFMEPMYSEILRYPTTPKDGRRYNLSLRVEESR